MIVGRNRAISNTEWFQILKYYIKHEIVKVLNDQLTKNVLCN